MDELKKYKLLSWFGMILCLSSVGSWFIIPFIVDLSTPIMLSIMMFPFLFGLMISGYSALKQDQIEGKLT